MIQRMALAGVVFLTACGAAPAQAPDPISAKIDALAVEMSSLKALQKKADDDVAATQREWARVSAAAAAVRVKEAQQPRDEADLQMRLADEQAAFEKKWSWLKPAADKYVARGCPLSGTVDKKTLARCGAEHEKLLAAQNDAQGELQTMRDEAAANEKAKAGLAKERQEISDQTLASIEAYKKAQAALDDAKTRLKAKTDELAAIIGQCRQQFSSAEEMKLKCGNVQFDGADPNLPPLQNQGIGSPKMQ